jgi:alpha-L-arabinofuranosidase
VAHIDVRTDRPIGTVDRRIFGSFTEHLGRCIYGGRPRRPELAWGAEESNRVGTDEFMAWAQAAGVDPVLCLTMGTGSHLDVTFAPHSFTVCEASLA